MGSDRYATQKSEEFIARKILAEELCHQFTTIRRKGAEEIAKPRMCGPEPHLTMEVLSLLEKGRQLCGQMMKERETAMHVFGFAGVRIFFLMDLDSDIDADMLQI